MPASQDAARPDPRGPRHPAGPAGRRARRAAVRVRRRPPVGGDVVADAGHPGGDACGDPAAHEAPGRLAFAVLDSATGEVRGSTSFYDWDPRIGRVEIGYTYYAPRWWGTTNNPACKLLMLTHAFETWGCARVAFRADARNAARSRPSDASARCRRASCAATGWPPTAPAATARTSRSSPTSGPRSAPAWRPGSAQRGDRARQVRLAAAGVPAGEREARRRDARDPHRRPSPGSSTGFANSTDQSNASAARRADVGERARRRVHAVRDRPREPERLGGQRRQVDRVAVAGDGRVPTADVAVELPPPGGRRAGRTRAAVVADPRPAGTRPRAR